MTRMEYNLATIGESAVSLSNGPPSPAPLQAPKKNLLRVIWRRKLIVLLALLAGAGGGYAYLQLATPIYRSGARIYVQQSGPKIISSDSGGDAAKSGNFLNTEIQLIGSGPIMAAALETPGVKSLKTFSGERGAMEVLSKGLTVSIGKNDDLITVAFESPYAEDIPTVVNALVDSYITYQSTRKKSTAAEVLKILQREKNKRDSETEAGLKAMLEFKQNHGELGFQGDKGNIIVQRLDRLSSALTEAELEVVETKAIYDAVTAMKDDPAKIKQYLDTRRATGNIIIGAKDEETRLEAELIALQLQLKTLKRQYAASHPAVTEAESRITTIQEQISKKDGEVAARQLAVIEQQYQAASQKLERVKTAYNDQLKEALSLNKVAADYARLQSAYEQAKKIAEVLDGRIKELNITEDVGALNISVLETAGKPATPVKPDHMKTIAMALAGGLLLGIGLCLLLDWADPRVSSAEEVAALVQMPVLGTLPLLKGRKNVQGYGLKMRQEPRSPTAEAFRAIRATLTYGMARAGVKSVLITSPGSGEGKSTLVSNLAIALAQAGQRVLVVDADFHKPRQHEIFKMDDQVGLTSILDDPRRLGEAIHSNGIPGLAVLSTGPLPADPADIINSPNFADVIKTLQQQYDVVLVDSPPAMSVTDALVLSALCDATLLVVRAEKSHRRMAEEARDGLLSVGARLAGVVVNGVSGKRGRYGYYGGYYGVNVQREAAAKPAAQPQLPAPENDV